MSTCDIVLSVSSCTAVGSAMTLTDSETAGRSSLTSRITGIVLRTSTGLCTAANPWVSMCSS